VPVSPPAVAAVDDAESDAAEADAPPPSIASLLVR
jgi:hypothetical protein